MLDTHHALSRKNTKVRLGFFTLRGNGTGRKVGNRRPECPKMSKFALLLFG
jgi:hypothetical protein